MANMRKTRSVKATKARATSARYVVYQLKKPQGKEPVTIRSNKGQVVTLYRNTDTGSFTTQRSAHRIRETSERAANSLRRLAKR